MKKKSQLLLFLVLILVSLVVLAKDESQERGKKSSVSFNRVRNGTPVMINAKWKAECSSCHMLYMPGLLPARSWTKMMDGLDKHFDENAGLDAPTKKEITTYLVQNSADNSPNRYGKKILDGIEKEDAPLRISKTVYFTIVHYDLDASTYKRKTIGSASNCIACHKGAEEGNFSQYQVRIPKDGEVMQKKAGKIKRVKT